MVVRSELTRAGIATHPNPHSSTTLHVLPAGVPFTDPIADGPTIQTANQVCDQASSLPCFAVPGFVQCCPPHTHCARPCRPLQIALDNGVDSYADCLEYVREARTKGLTAPVVFMGYYNPVVAYGEERLVRDCAQFGVSGFIIVDLPPEESLHFRKLCREHGCVWVLYLGCLMEQHCLLRVWWVDIH